MFEENSLVFLKKFGMRYPKGKIRI